MALVLRWLEERAPSGGATWGGGVSSRPQKLRPPSLTPAPFQARLLPWGLCTIRELVKLTAYSPCDFCDNHLSGWPTFLPSSRDSPDSVLSGWWWGGAGGPRRRPCEGEGEGQSTRRACTLRGSGPSCDTPWGPERGSPLLQPVSHLKTHPACGLGVGHTTGTQHTGSLFSQGWGAKSPVVQVRS